MSDTPETPPAKEPPVIRTLRVVARFIERNDQIIERMPFVAALHQHSGDLSTLAKAVDGCGKEWYDGLVGVHRRCKSGRWLCPSCWQDRDSAIQALLGRT